MNKQINRRIAVSALALGASFGVGVTGVALTQHEAPVVRMATDNRGSIDSPTVRPNALRSPAPVPSGSSSGEFCAAGGAVSESRTAIVLVSHALHLSHAKTVTRRVSAICYLV